MTTYRANVQLRGPKLYKKQGKVFQEEFDRPNLFRPSLRNRWYSFVNELAWGVFFKVLQINFRKSATEGTMVWQRVVNQSTAILYALQRIRLAGNVWLAGSQSYVAVHTESLLTVSRPSVAPLCLLSRYWKSHAPVLWRNDWDISD